MKLQNEARKILDCPQLNVTCTCVRVPVMRCHSEAIILELTKTMDLEQIKEALRKGKGIELNESSYPTPLDCVEQDHVVVGRVRQDRSDANTFVLWCCGDQLHKGVATNAVQIAELFLK